MYIFNSLQIHKKLGNEGVATPHCLMEARASEGFNRFPEMDNKCTGVRMYLSANIVFFPSAILQIYFFECI